MTVRTEIKRISRDDLKRALASLIPLSEFIKIHFPEFDDSKGDSVAFLEETLEEDGKVVSLRQNNEVAIRWKSFR
jgi:hypothetical protein